MTFLLVLLQLIILVLLVFILVSRTMSSIHGAPFIGIGRRHLDELLHLAQIGPGDIVYDLGSGDGRVIIRAVGTHGAEKGVGYEIASWPYLKARLFGYHSKLGSRVLFKRVSLFRAPVVEADVVYMYLYPKLIQKAAAKLAEEARSGTRVLCPSFPIDTQQLPEFHLVKSKKIGSVTAYLYEVARH